MSIAIEADHTASEIADESHPILDVARAKARHAGLKYAGDVIPEEAWDLFTHGNALLVDVRTLEERKNVGYVPSSLHAAWAIGNPMERNPNFVRELGILVDKLDVILFLCRSGKRSVAAAEAVSRLGFKNVFNVFEGFEGEPGQETGWRAHGLPWTKD
jgi:rhodanese-related sulfurtransferase